MMLSLGCLLSRKAKPQAAASSTLDCCYTLLDALVADRLNILDCGIVGAILQLFWSRTCFIALGRYLHNTSRQPNNFRLTQPRISIFGLVANTKLEV